MTAMVPAGMVHKQKTIVAAFRAAGATAPGGATTAAALGLHEGLAFRTLCRHAVLRDAGDRRLYLDEPAWESHQARRRRVGLACTLLGVLAVAIVLAVWATHE